MYKHWIGLAACLLALLMISGCRSSGAGEQGSTTAPQQTDQNEILPPETTVPEDTSADIGTIIGTSPITPPDGLWHPDVTQTRLSYRTTNWKSAFNTENGCFLLADSVASVNDGLQKAGVTADMLDVSAYDDTFFQANRLMIIPMTSNSGSIQYKANVNFSNGTFTIKLEGKLSGDAGTADMADWLVAVILPKNTYPIDTPITLANNQSYTGDLVISNR